MPHPKTRVGCFYKGCPAVFTKGTPARVYHVAKPHHKCTCGRYFERKWGYPAHLREIGKGRVPNHPPTAPVPGDAHCPQCGHQTFRRRKTRYVCLLCGKTKVL